MKKIIFAFAILFLASCSGDKEKILVMSRGKATIDQDTKTISALTNANDHQEQTLEFTGNEKLNLSVNSKAGKNNIEIPGKGYYVLNTKPDTIVGSFVQYSTPEQANHRLTQEELKKDIDSLQQLIQNKNVSAANRNYFIVPNTAVKITENYDAEIIGPYHQITSMESQDGKAPEVYRFYNIGEIRETIARLQKLTGMADSAAHK